MSSDDETPIVRKEKQVNQSVVRFQGLQDIQAPDLTEGENEQEEEGAPLFDFPGVKVPLRRPEEEFVMESHDDPEGDAGVGAQIDPDEDKLLGEEPPRPFRRFGRNTDSGSSGNRPPSSVGGHGYTPSDPDFMRSVGTTIVDSSKAIRVGTFKINGELKCYAIVPPLKINSQPDLQRLMDYWEVSHPNFLLETNESNTDQRVTEENAPYILEKVFPGDKAPSRKVAAWSLRNVRTADNADTTESSAGDYADEWGWLNRYLER